MKKMNTLGYAMDHACYSIVHTNDMDVEYTMFSSSIDVAFMISSGFDTPEKIDEVMIKILNDVSTHRLSVVEKNYVYISKKTGIGKQRYRTRIIKFDGINMIYHNRNIDASIAVNPHFHILANSSDRLGLRFMYLMDAMREKSAYYGLKFHFDAEKLNTVTGLTKRQEKTIESMALTMQRGTDDDVRLYLMDDKIDRALENLTVHWKYTKNTAYYFKQISIASSRLRKLDISMNFMGIDLNKSIPFLLTQQQYETIQKIKSEQPVTLDLRAVFDREILKFAYGFDSSVVDIIMEKFLISDVKKENLKYEYVVNVQKDKVSTTNDFISLVKQDIRNAISISYSFDEFKKIMRTMEYIDISVENKKINKTTKREVGLKIETKKHTSLVINFSSLRIDLERMQRIFLYNSKKRKKKKQIESRIKNYKRIEKENTEKSTMFVYKLPEFLTILYGRNSDFLMLPKPLLEEFTVECSAMYGITTYKSDNMTLVEYPDRLEIKKCTDIDKALDVLMKFMPAGKTMDDVGISLRGSELYIDGLKKRIDGSYRKIEEMKESPKKQTLRKIRKPKK